MPLLKDGLRHYSVLRNRQTDGRWQIGKMYVPHMCWVCPLYRLCVAGSNWVHGAGIMGRLRWWITLVSRYSLCVGEHDMTSFLSTTQDSLDQYPDQCWSMRINANQNTGIDPKFLSIPININEHSLVLRLREHIGIAQHWMLVFWSALIGIDRHWALIEGVLSIP